MNNEERILELLSGLSEKVSVLTEDVSGMQKNMSGLTEKVSGLTDQVSSLTEKVEEIDQRSIRTQVLLETEFHDKLQLLYEGHHTIMQKLDALAPRERVEVLEDEVISLKTAVKIISNRLAALEKAQ